MTVLIADDNTLIRNWLKILLQQFDPALQIIEAVDGDEALSICLAQPIDLLITDIKMPGMDGITLIKTLQSQCPSVLSAVLSSYDDFSYVRTALKCGALDYILKPEMTQDDIATLMHKTQEMRTLHQGTDNYAEKYTAAIQAAQTAYHDFIHGVDTTGDQLLSCCGLGDDCSVLSLILFHVSPSPTGNAQMIASLFTHTLEEHELKGLALPTKDTGFLALHSLPDASGVSAQEIHLKLLSTFEQTLDAVGAGTLLQNVTLSFARTDSLIQKLHSAHSLIDFQAYYSRTRLPNQSISDDGAEWELLKKIQHLLALQDYRYPCSLLRQYIHQRHTAFDQPDRIRRAVTAATQMMLGAVPSSCTAHEQYLNLEQLIRGFSMSDTQQVMEEKVAHFCHLYTKLVGNPKRISHAVSQAISYCDEHYASKIMLEDVANIVRLNKSYFSQLFHKEMGMPFGVYLEQVRVQKAQFLLKSSALSMSEIAEQVGFSSQNYFTKVFKKGTGLTPSQYRSSQNFPSQKEF